MIRRPLAAAVGLAVAAVVAVPATSTGATRGPATTTLVPAGTTADAPLRADAGDSAFVGDVDFVPLLGTGYGGTGLYSFSWKVEGGGTVKTPDQASTLLAAEGLESGLSTVTLTVTDTAGAVATDTVRVAVGDLPGAVTSIDAAGPYRFVDGAAQKLAGKVEGGSHSAGWDTDLDGVVDLQGATATANLPLGRHLVVFRVVDSHGLERQRMTSVFVGSAEQVRSQQVPLTVIGIADSGINMYHQEFSAAAYPDPRVLELTNGFTRHPSEYLPGYPKDAKALPISLGKGYFPKGDEYLFDGNTYIEPGELYWIPGTKIVGAVEAGGSTGATSGADAHPILDDNGHGTGSSSVSAGNRYGYCPTCLLVHVEALDETVVADMEWVDLSSNSFGYVGGLPLGPVFGTSEETKAAAERGQTTLYAAGNGIGNAFDVPIVTYGSDQTGPDWNITVGALRRDNQGAIVGDGIPADISSWGDGNLPSACRSTTISQCAFGGTSAATPYTAGVFGTVLTEIRRMLGDSRTGQRPGQVVAKGAPVAGSPYLADGELTRQELRAAVLKTAQPLNETSGQNRYVFPLTYTGTQSRYVFEGYGAATPNSATRAIAVLLGTTPMPARPAEDANARQVCEQRAALSYGGNYDRDGDGEADPCSEAYHSDERFIGDGEPTTDAAAPGVAAYDPARARVSAQPATKPFTYYLHRTYQIGTGEEVTSDVDSGTTSCSTDVKSDSSFMTRDDRNGDLEPCYESRITSVVASYRPLGIWAAPDTLDAPLPAGSTVDVELYLAADAVAAEVRGVLVATDRQIGRGGMTGTLTPTVDPAQCKAMGEACWTKFAFSFTTDRPAVAGEQLTFQAEQTTTRAYAYGYEGGHVSTFTVTPAAESPGLEFGVTADKPAAGAAGEPVTVRGAVAFPALGEDPKKAGFHPTSELVQLSVDDRSFLRPLHATIDRAAGTWSVQVPGLGSGPHTLYVRALRDRTPSPVVALSLGASATTAAAPPPPATAGARLPATGASTATALLGLLVLTGGLALRRRSVRVR